MTSNVSILSSLAMGDFPNHFPLHIFSGLVIGVTGKAGSGKDTFALMLHKEIDKLTATAKIDIYARPLKEAYVAK